MERVVAIIEKDPRNQDLARQFAIKSALRTLFDAGVVYPGAEAIIAALSPQARIEASERPREALVLPSADQLVHSERKALGAFFGKDIVVPEPPVGLFTTLERLSELSIAGFDPHYLPEHALKERDRLPGWIVKPERWFWEQMKDGGSLSQDAATLKEGWYLVDRRGKPNYQDGEQMYEDDYLAPLMENLRGTGRIQKYRFVPDNSRFGASADEIEQVVLPELAGTLGFEGIVRNKREIEFNVLGNMHYPEWGKTNTWEWFGDKFGGARRLFGGRSGGGGLADVYCAWSGYRRDCIGFGPLVEFPSKA